VGAKISITERIFKDNEGNPTGKRRYVNVQKMQLLSEILEATAKKIIITVNLPDLTQEIYGELVRIFERYKGDKSVLFVMNHLENNTQLKLPATKTKVEITKELLDELRSLPDLNFQLN